MMFQVHNIQIDDKILAHRNFSNKKEPRECRVLLKQFTLSEHFDIRSDKNTKIGTDSLSIHTHTHTIKIDSDCTHNSQYVHYINAYILFSESARNGICTVVPIER